MACSSFTPLDRLEVIRRMASLAVVTEFTVMHVIAAVASAAGIADLDINRHRARMAGLATKFPVCSIDLEPGLPVVIELPDRPVGRAVTGTAIRAELLLVNIFVTMAVETRLRRVAETGCFVAIRAYRITVSADEWKHGKAMVEQNAVRPAPFAVTLSAGLAELILMRVVFPVTGVTFCIQTDFMHRSGMTVGATDACMRAQQSELRVDVMLEQRRRPCRRGMTGLAVRAIQTLVLIVVRVTGETLGLQAELELVLDVAGGAGNLPVGAGQRENRLARMIEKRFLPAIAGMAESTIRAVQAIVRVVVAVTAVALRRRILIPGLDVAGGALRVEMPPGQRVTGLDTVVEFDFAPRRGDMTGLAVLAESALMFIVFDMAIETQ
jgi:hypothetical protein